jgi:two-component system, OmpR family, heavy metal sensor histidine kinase CusS
MLKKPLSISARLVVFCSLSVFVILLFSSLYLNNILVSNLQKQQYSFLKGEVSVIQHLLRTKPNEPDALKQEVIWEPSALGANHLHYYCRILSDTHETLLETDGMKKAAPLDLFPKPLYNKPDPNRKITQVHFDDRHFRLISVYGPFGNSKESRIIQIALDVTKDRQLLHRYRDHLLLVLIVGFLLSILLGFFVARQSLKPLTRLAKHIQRISAKSLNQPISLLEWPKELIKPIRAINQLLLRAHKAFSRMTQFSGNIAHELRTPLNNLTLQSETLLTKPRENQDYIDALSSNLEEYQRLARLIDKLLFIARAENPQTHLNLKKIQLEHKISQLIEYYTYLAEEKNIRFKLKLHGHILADETLFQRALGNTISNAIKYTHTGDTIIIESAKKQGKTVIRITDHGPGIEQQHIPHIFDRFYRTDSARTKQTGGSGLGLAIVQTIMQLHGGKATIESEPGKATTISLIF